MSNHLNFGTFNGNATSKYLGSVRGFGDQGEFDKIIQGAGWKLFYF